MHHHFLAVNQVKVMSDFAISPPASPYQPVSPYSFNRPLFSRLTGGRLKISICLARWRRMARRRILNRDRRR
jgi:hypothetical protein